VQLLDGQPVYSATDLVGFLWCEHRGTCPYRPEARRRSGSHMRRRNLLQEQRRASRRAVGRADRCGRRNRVGLVATRIRNFRGRSLCGRGGPDLTRQRACSRALRGLNRAARRSSAVGATIQWFAPAGNAQVAALVKALPPGARVGTVDKFQGQEAAVVFYSLTTSSPRPRASRHGVPVLPEPPQCGHLPGPLPRGHRRQPRAPQGRRPHPTPDELANALCRAVEVARSEGMSA
jgi:hypothetical protein